MKKINWRYAIGELLIVVIGISIAFGLNNWATQSGKEKTTQTYLENLKDDLRHDVLLLDSNIAEMSRRRQYFAKLYPHFYSELAGRDTMAMQVFRYADPPVFRSRDATWQSMKFSGDIKLIKDLKLKNAIVEHYTQYAKVDDQLERHRTFAKDYLAPYFMRDIQYAKLRQENYPFLEHTYFQNLMRSLDGIYRLEIEAHQNAKKSAEALLVNLKD